MRVKNLLSFVLLVTGTMSIILLDLRPGVATQPVVKKKATNAPRFMQTASFSGSKHFSSSFLSMQNSN